MLAWLRDEEDYCWIRQTTRWGFSMKLLLTFLLLAVGSSVWAECACLCADGELRTMCTSVGEAQANPNLCTTNSAQCPLDSGAPSGDSYDAPEGAVDCRSMRVWDATENAFLDVAACNVLENS
jgi:hypothetical protein